MFRRCVLALAGLALCISPFAAGAPPPQPDPQAIAGHILERLAAGDFAGAGERFSPKVRAALPAAALAAVWQQLGAQFGPFRRRLPGRVEELPQASVVVVPCEFERAALDFKVSLDSNRQVVGLVFVPPAVQPSSPAADPTYIQPDRFQESPVSVPTPVGDLPGRLALPVGTGPFPGVVLLGGSGPTDYDGTVGPNRPLRDLALGLASAGIATLRYSKRAAVYPAAFAGQNFTVREEVLDDARSAFALLARSPQIDRRLRFALGHSLGGTLLPRLGAAEPQLAGLIMLAASARPLADLLIDQLTYLAGLDPKVKPQLAAVRRQVARLNAPDFGPTTPAAELPFGLPARYWLDLDNEAPPAVARRLPQPLLVLQGGRDYQVSTVDFDLWQRSLTGRPKTVLKLYPALNHLFVVGEGKSTPAEYQRPGHVEAQVIVDIAGWIRAQTPI